VPGGTVDFQSSGTSSLLCKRPRFYNSSLVD